MKFNRRFVFDIILVLALLGAGFYYRAEAEKFVRQQYNHFYPCSIPLHYTIGQFDTRFGVSRAEFQDALDQAIAIWEGPTKRTFFQYDASSTPATADLVINLEYDYRQQATVTLQNIDTKIKADQASYDQLKQTYQNLTSTYESQKDALAAEADQYQADKAAYEKDVAAANAAGGATKSQYAAFEQRRNDLNTEANTINQKQQALNDMVTTINADVADLNAMAKELNLNVGDYNDVGSSTGSEFEEGEYVSNIQGSSINIYQFSNEDKLVRVLAHELGHALGLEHVDDPKAIMYKYNEGVNTSLTAADLAELDSVCKIK